MSAFLQGVLMGLTITVSFGPGFIALFQTSIMRGVKAGFVLAVGILMSDLILIGASYLGLAQLIHENNALATGIITGIILIVTGGVSVFRKSVVYLNETKPIADLKRSLPSLLLRGFILNIANPFCLIFWVGIMGFAASNFGINSFGFFIFFAGLLITAFTSDLLKCYLSGALRKVFTPKIITSLNKTMGLILLLAGFYIIYKVFN